ncbi:MAG: hypothetical protein OEL88_16930 [Sterolibacteriaceae bacterium MAG5]|nr:hypothetical protein [Candidatus Nitricoxidireducens bremensis]
MTDRASSLRALAITLAMGMSMNAMAGLLGLGGTSWKEEVLLHDGTKIVAERWVARGGRHEIGQQPPITEQSLTFILPTTNERIAWKIERSEDVGIADFKPILLDIVQGTPYLVSTPVGCLSYNKWSRPNPPYVIFKYQSGAWSKIAIHDLPIEIKAPNLIISSPDSEMDRAGKSFMTANEIQKLNSSLTQPEYRAILRESLPQERINQMCEELVRYKCGWGAPGEFNRQYFERICK